MRTWPITEVLMLVLTKTTRLPGNLQVMCTMFPLSIKYRSRQHWINQWSTLSAACCKHVLIPSILLHHISVYLPLQSIAIFISSLCTKTVVITPHLSGCCSSRTEHNSTTYSCEFSSSTGRCSRSIAPAHPYTPSPIVDFSPRLKAWGFYPSQGRVSVSLRTAPVLAGLPPSPQTPSVSPTVGVQRYTSDTWFLYQTPTSISQT